MGREGESNYQKGENETTLTNKALDRNQAISKEIRGEGEGKLM